MESKGRMNLRSLMPRMQFSGKFGVMFCTRFRMTTKVDLSKLMQDAEEKSSTEHKKPLADKHNERTPASISNVAIRRTTKSMKSSSASLLPLVLLIAVLSSLIFYTFRLEMRVRKLEQDLGSHVALHKALSEAAAETAQSPTPKPADAAASATPPPEVTGATERSSPSPLTFVENKGTPHDWMIEAINEIGSGSEVVAVYSSEVGDLEDELFDDELRNEDTFSDGLDESFDSYNEWSGDGLPSTESSSSDSETFSESLGSYLDLFGYRSNGLSVPSAVAHERRRRSAAGMQPGDEPLAEQRTGNNDGEFADDDIMMADDAPPQPSSSAGSNERRTPRGRQREGTGSSATHEEQPKGRNTEVRNETSSRKASAAGPPATGRLAASEESRQSRNRQSRTQYVKQVSRNQPPTSAKAAARTLSSGTGIKVAHFVAPKQISHYVTDKMPPGAYTIKYIS